MVPILLNKSVLQGSVCAFQHDIRFIGKNYLQRKGHLRTEKNNVLIYSLGASIQCVAACFMKIINKKKLHSNELISKSVNIHHIVTNLHIRGQGININF